MFLPPPEFRKKSVVYPTTKEQPVILRSSHLVLHRDIVKSLFRDDKTIYMVYYTKKRTLMVAPYFNELFRTIHKAKQYMMKEVAKNTENAIPLHGILLDNEIDSGNRALSYNADSDMNILTVEL